MTEALALPLIIIPMLFCMIMSLPRVHEASRVENVLQCHFEESQLMERGSAVPCVECEAGETFIA